MKKTIIASALTAILGVEAGMIVFRPSPEYVAHNDAIPGGDYVLTHGAYSRQVHVRSQDAPYRTQMVWVSEPDPDWIDLQNRKNGNE